MKDKFFTAAKAVAMNSPGVGPKNTFRLGAVIVEKNSILSVGNNSYKTHPLMASRTEWPFLHAEQLAIIRRGLDHCDGHDLYVVRILKHLNYAISFPCKVCQKLIADVGIQNIFYINDGGQYSKWNR